MAHLAVHLAADGAAPTTAPLRTSFVLCIRPADASPSAARRRRPPTYGQPEKLPTANEFGDRSAEIAAAAAAVAWDEETVLRQLRALGASDAAARGRRPDVYFTHGSLKPILAEGALPATLASLPASQILLLLAVSCGVRAAEVSLGDGGVALPRGAAAERLDALLARGDATELFAALAAVAAEGGDGAAADSWDVASEALREDVDAEAAAQAARARRIYAQSDALHREGVERKWGGALKRLRANDESLTELRLSAAPRQPTAAEHAAAMVDEVEEEAAEAAAGGDHGLHRPPPPLPQFLRPCVAQRRAAAASAQRDRHTAPRSVS